jgi:RNA polymerase sigma-70 factor (ECF subfamily)
MSPVAFDKCPDFDKIFIEYYSQLCVYSFRYLHDKQAVEDIVQDVFCHFIEKWATIRNKEAIRGFLFQSTKNATLDYLKSMNNHQGDINYNIDEVDLNNFIDCFVYNQAGDDYDYQVLSYAVESVIKQMPERQREVFLMSRREKLTNKEIATRLDISIKAVEKHITKSLSMIRKELVQNRLITLLVIFVLSMK